MKMKHEQDQQIQCALLLSPQVKVQEDLKGYTCSGTI